MRRLLVISTIFLFSTLCCIADSSMKEPKGVISIDSYPWGIEVYQNGYVKATIGAVDSMGMPPGSVDYNRLLEYLRAQASETEIKGSRPVFFRREGEKKSARRYIKIGNFLNELFPSNPKAWRRVGFTFEREPTKPEDYAISNATKAYVEPLPERMKNLLSTHPIFPAKLLQK